MKRGLIASLLALLLAGCSAIPGNKNDHADTSAPLNKYSYDSAVRLGRLTPPFTTASEKVAEGLAAQFFGETKMYVLKDGTSLKEPGTDTCKRFKGRQAVTEASGKLVLLCSRDLEEAAVVTMGSGKPDVQSVTSVTLKGATLYKDGNTFASSVLDGESYRTTKPSDDTATLDKLDAKLLDTWRRAFADFYGQTLVG